MTAIAPSTTEHTLRYSFIVWQQYSGYRNGALLAQKKMSRKKVLILEA